MRSQTWRRSNGLATACQGLVRQVACRRPCVLAALLALSVYPLVPEICLATDFLVLPDGTGIYPTIQAAVDASAPGDTITLGEGVFAGPGNRDVSTFWPLLIRSQSGDPALTELLGDPTADGILVWDSTGGSVLAGITFSGFDLGVHLGEYPAHQAVHHCRFQACRIGLGIENSHSVIEDCLFQDNDSGGDGAAVFTLSTSRFTRCIFTGNETQSSGGAVKSYTSELTFQSCLFINNRAGNEGGAIWIEEGGSLDLVNCTFYGNVCPDGSAVHSGYHTQTHFHNCIVAFGQGYPVSCRYSAPTFYCSDVYGNAGGDWVGCGLDQQQGVAGNICFDPLFCDPTGGDFRLQPESPCAPFSPYSPECDLMGALPVGCPSSDVPEQATPLQPAGLLPIRPNPSFGPVSILLPRVVAAAGTSVRVEVYDAAGRIVRTLRAVTRGRAERPPSAEARPAAGIGGAIAFDACNERGDRLPSGIYLVRMTAGAQALSSSFVLIR